MKQPLIWTLFLGLVGCNFQPAGPTPLDYPLREQEEINITCRLTEPPKYTDVPVFDSSEQSEAAKGTYHYKLWLPKGYLADPQRRWPCLFIMSPQGNAAMENMGPWLKSHGYVVVMLVEAQNGPWEPIIGNFVAAHDDVAQRVRIQEGRKIATGVSGGARASSIFARIRPGFSGLILQGAGIAYGDNGNYYSTGIRGNATLNIAMTMGNADGNKREVELMKTLLQGTPFLALYFDGGHTMAPAAVFAQAMEWIEHQEAVQGDGKATPPAE